MSKIIVITGPTGVGKTKISLLLASYYNAQIINADSRYLYKEPSIATAKITKEEMNGIKHHMIDIISLNDDYSIFNYQKDARKILNNLISNNKSVIVVGGSGLYIKSLLYSYTLNETVKTFDNFDNYSNKELKEMADSISNNDIHINNRKRLIRYINYYKENNKPLSKSEEINKKMYDFDIIYLNTDREKLYNRINNRTEEMFKNGLLEEAKKLKEYKHFNDIIGYKELMPYFDKKITLEEAKEQIKLNTRHYAKRQETWFKNQIKDINIVEMNYDNINETLSNIINICDKKN